MGVKERLIDYLDVKRISKRAFAISIGASPAFVNNISNNIGPKFIESIKLHYPDLNMSWLLTGEGAMLKTDAPENDFADQVPSAHLVPLLPLYAQGGPLNDFVESIREIDCEKVISPIAGADFAITITGDSMAPEYPSGSRILIKRVDEKAFIEWGRVYVLDTMNGTVVKEVRKGNSDDEVMCYSLNPDPKFQPFAVKFSNIFGFYKVMLCLSLK